jgi:hypothetical protein
VVPVWKPWGVSAPVAPARFGVELPGPTTWDARAGSLPVVAPIDAALAASEGVLPAERQRAAAPVRLPFELPIPSVAGGVASGSAGAALLFFLCLCSFLWVAPPLRRWLRLQFGVRLLPVFVAPLEQPG